MLDRRERDGELTDALLVFGEGLQSSIWTALPGIVEAVDLVRQVVSIMPAIQGRYQPLNGPPQWVTLPLLTECPIHFPRGGGGLLTFPIAVGDEGLVVFASRCIDTWWQQGCPALNGGHQAQIQHMLRMHDLSDGFFIPGFSSVPRVAPNIDPTWAEFRSLDGNAKVRLHPTTHEIDLNTTGNLAATVGGTTAINSTGAATITAPTINLNGTVVINGEAYTTHRHSGVTAGPANTGGKV